MKKKALTLSIVIPAYNEEDHLRACLDSIGRQTVKPAKVFVVDNNSIDGTVQLAKQYPFVTLLKEKKQHQVFAQAKGFDAVKSDLIARIDADCILPQSWVKQAVSIMAKRPEVLAMTGSGEPYDVPLKKVGTWMFRTYHENLSGLIAGHVMLWGSNMVFRANVWPRLKRVMHFRADIWEDYDMSFHLAKIGVLRYEESLKVACSFRAAHKSLLHQFRYQLRGIRTFYIHKSLVRATAFALVWATLGLLYPFPFIDRYLWRFRHLRSEAIQDSK